MSDNIAKKKVVMQVIPSLESGGVERGVIDICKALKKTQEFEPIVVSNGGILTYQLKESGIHHIKLPLHKKNPISIFLNIKKISSIIKQYNVDLIHVRSRAPMWSVYFACKKSDVKIVTTVHGTYSLNFLGWKVFWPKKIYNSIMLQANYVVAVSNFIKKYVRKNYRQYSSFDSFVKNRKSFVIKKFLNIFSFLFLKNLFSKNIQKNHKRIKNSDIVVIHRGVDLNYFNSDKISINRMIDLSKKWGIPEDKKIILMPARFTSWKGHEFLIDSLSMVKNDFFCVMVGSSHGHHKFRKKIEQKIIQQNLAGKIRVVDVCKDMPVAYAISHFVVCPSIKAEAFGRISIEAQSSKKIIIATAIGGSLETIIDGKTGFLVKPHDKKNMSLLIDNILEMSQEEISKITSNARKNVEENFSNEKLINTKIDLYKKILNV